MASIRDRYVLCPQLDDYDRIPQVLSPYVTLISQPNFRTATVNTDGIGFRISTKGFDSIDSSNWAAQKRRGIVLGGSFVFGVGATGDRYTVASVLNNATSFSFLNLGIRAANSLQELIAAAPFLPESEAIIVCSGLNNLVVNLQSLGQNEIFCPLFGEEHFERLRKLGVMEVSSAVESSLRGTPAVKLLKELGGRVRRRLSSGGPERESAENGGYTRDFVEKKCHEAVALTLRDLRVLVKSRPAHSKILFAMQLFAGGCSKILSQEEKKMFQITDDLPLPHWQVLKSALNEIWPRYTQEIREGCDKEGVPFVDLNQLPLSGWCFVDRAHLTDSGYAQVAGYLAEMLA